MPTKDGFNPDEPLPLFLADRTEQPRAGSVSDRVVLPSRALTACVLVLIATATALGITAFSTGNPVTLFASLTASLVDQSALQPGAGQSTATMQATADARASSPTATDAPAGGDIAAAEPAGQDQAKMSASSSEALLRQFQAWADEEDAQAQVEPARSVQDASAQPVQEQPVQSAAALPVKDADEDADAPAQVAQDAPAQDAPAQVARETREPRRLMHKQRHLDAVRNARAEMLKQESRKTVRREHHSRLRVPPAQAVRAQDELVQNAEPPSLLQGFGFRN